MLTELQMKKWTHLFHIYDTDGSGVVTKEDFELKARAVASLHGLEPGSDAYESLYAKVLEDWDHLQKHVDKNNDNRVDLEEWLDHGYTRINDDRMYATVQQEVDGIFGLFDRNGDGLLSQEEYISLITTWGAKAEGADSMFSKLGLGKDDTLTKERVRQLLEEFHKSDDPDAPGNYFFGPF